MTEGEYVGVVEKLAAASDTAPSVVQYVLLNLLGGLPFEAGMLLGLMIEWGQVWILVAFIVGGGLLSVCAMIPLIRWYLGRWSAERRYGLQFLTGPKL
jgi:hypothetical protein